MKAKAIGSVAVAMLLMAPALFAGDTIDNDDWLSKHAVTRTTETTERDAAGNIKCIRALIDTTIYIKQTVSEIKKPDAKGVIRTISRTTTTTDTLGGSATITETLLAGSSTLITTGITTVDKTADGLVTTTYAKDKTGNMVVLNKIKSVTVANGDAPAVVLPQ